MDSEVSVVSSPTRSRSPSGLANVVYAVMPQLCVPGGTKAGGIRTSRRGGEVQGEGQAAVGGGVEGGRGGGGLGDRGDDGGAGAVPAGLVGAVGAETLERLQQ